MIQFSKSQGCNTIASGVTNTRSMLPNGTQSTLFIRTLEWWEKSIPLQKLLIGSATLKQDSVNVLHMPSQVEHEWSPQAWVDSGQEQIFLKIDIPT